MPWQMLTASRSTCSCCAVTTTDTQRCQLQHRHDGVHHLWLTGHADGNNSLRPRELEEDIGDAVQVSALESALRREETGDLSLPGEAEIARVRDFSAVPFHRSAW